MGPPRSRDQNHAVLKLGAKLCLSLNPPDFTIRLSSSELRLIEQFLAGLRRKLACSSKSEENCIRNLNFYFDLLVLVS